VADRTVSVKLRADISDYTSGLAKAAAATHALSGDVGKAGQQAGVQFGAGIAQGVDSPAGRTSMRLAGERSSGVLAQGIRGGLIRNSPLIVAGISGALAAGAPAVLAGGTVLMGGLAAAIAAQSPQVQAAFSTMWEKVKAGAQEDAAGLIPVFERVAAGIGDSFDRMRPYLREAFAALGPQIEDFSRSVTNAAERALPGLVEAVRSGGPVIEGLGTFLESIGQATGDFFAQLSQHAPAAGEAFAALGDIFAELMPILGELLGQGAELAADVLPMIADALGVVRDLVGAIGPMLPALVTGFAALSVAGSGLGSVSRGMQDLGRHLGGVDSGFSRAGRALGGFSAALPIVGAGVGLLISALEESDRNIERNTALYSSWHDALAQGGAAAEKAAGQFAMLEAAQSDPSSAPWFMREEFRNGDVSEALDAAATAAHEFWESLSPLEQATAKVAEWTSTLSWRLGEYGANSEEVRIAQERLAYWTGQQAVAQEELDAATAASMSGQELFAQQIEETRETVDEAQQAVDDYKLSLDVLTGANVSMIQVEAELQEAIADANGALEGMNGTVLDGAGNLDLQSESGRAASEILLEVRDSGNQLIATMIQQGKSTDDVRAADARLREDFIRTAGQMGINREAAEGLADQILGIPASRNTTITADTSQAQRDIDNFVISASGRRIQLGVSVSNEATQFANRAGRAQGGVIYGPGGPTSDSIPAWLSNGEYVIKAASVSKYGLAFLDAVNSGRMAQFAEGGPISPTPAGRFPVPVDASTAGAATSFSDILRGLQSYFTAISEPAQSASGGSSNGLLPIMAAARQYTMDTYGVRNIGGYANRNIAGTNVKSDHAMGKAIDIMTTNLGLGWQIANDFAYGYAHRKFRAENVIWQQSISSNGGPFKGMADRGSPTQNHRDHVHVDTFDTGGWLRPGLTLAYNGTGENERVLTGREWSGMSGGGAVTVAAPDLDGMVITGTLDLGDGLEARIDGRLASVGGLVASTARAGVR